ncbi:hypothetical protein [Paracoccus beibuensis]|uniref:hypothetical protein n=1 Tax=Paracoccus beibuensis TaxID=547602 RepID=UPI00223EA7E7|nr:hypothetical protein [Paracoccus beibuensis]
MTDKAEQILLELVKICGTLGAKTVARDHRFTVKAGDATFIDIRSEGEQFLPPEGASTKPAKAKLRRWLAKAEIRVYLHSNDPTKLRGEYSGIWLAFLDGFQASRIVAGTHTEPAIIPVGYVPEIECTYHQPGEAHDCGLIQISLGIPFDR